MISIGKNIQYYRKKKGFSQKELAQKLNCSTGAIQQYELGKREPNFEMACKIADILNIKPYMLYDYDEEIDTTEERFIKACEWLEAAGFEVNSPKEDDFFQKYFVDSSELGTICQMDKTDLINAVESCVEDANKLRDDIAVQFIQKTLLKQ